MVHRAPVRSPKPAPTFPRISLLLTLVLAPSCKGASEPPARPVPPDAAPAVRAPTDPKAKLKVSGIRLFGGRGLRPDALYARGEVVELRALLSGFRTRDRRIRLLASLRLTGPDKRLLARREGFVVVDQAVPKGKSSHLVETALRLPLAAASPPGPYRVNLRFKDALGGGEVTHEVTFRVVGPKPVGGAGLTIQQLRAAPDADLRAGLPLGVELELAGLTARPGAKREGVDTWTVKAEAEAEVLDRSGRIRHRATRTLVEATLPFPPVLVPARWRIDLPATLPPGSYLLRLRVRDALGSAQALARAEHRFRLLPGGLGIYAVQVSGAGDVPRRSFMRGELVLVDLVLAGWKPPADLELDIGLVGPDHGFYLVRKGAHRVRNAGATPKHRPLRIPLLIPEFAPTGRWTLKLRLRAPAQRQEAAREVAFQVTGPRITPLPSLQVSQLAIRQAPGGPPLPGRFLRAGATYHFDLVVGGVRLTREAGYYHRVDLRCALRLRDPTGRLVASEEKACEVKRRFSFAPLRLRLTTRWTLPATALGIHQLEAEVLDRQSNRVSMLQRRVFVLIPR